MFKRTTLALASVLMLPMSIGAQEIPTASRITGVEWHTAGFTKFKEGQANAGKEIIYGHFIKADEVAGRRPVPFDFVTGEWDHVVFFPLKDGPGDLTWATSPDDVKWWEALVEIEGGVEEAQALMTRFGELVARSEMHLVRRRN
jgi:hypothetical protein